MNEWVKGILEFSAAGGTLLAALSARKSAQISNRQLETQIEEKKQVDRPRLVPLNHRFSINIDVNSIFSDWKTKKGDSSLRFKNKDQMSRFHVPLINTGKTHAFDVQFSFKLQGGVASFQDFENKDIRISLENPDLRQLGVDYFNFKALEYNARNPGASVEQTIEIIHYPQYIPLIQNDKSSELYLPKFFVILSNIHLESYWLQGQTIDRPKVIVTIQYKDQLNNQHVDQYLMSLSTKQILTHGTEINTWIDFTYIKPPTEKKPTR